MPDVVNGIVLDSFAYKETSLIVRVYTKQHGIVSILVNGVRKKAAKYSLAYFQPLCYIDFQLYYKNTSTLYRADSFYFPSSVQQISNDVGKSAIAMFVAEVVLRTSKEREIDTQLFKLLEHIVLLLDSTTKGMQDVHLYFLYLYSTILGLSLEHFQNFTGAPAIQEGVFQHLEKMSRWTTAGYQPLLIAKEEKSILIRWVLRYFEEHLGSFSVKSLKILEDIFLG